MNKALKEEEAMLGKRFQDEGARGVQSDYQQREEVAQLEERVVKERMETRQAMGFMVLEGRDFTVMDGSLSQVSRGRDGTSSDWIQVCSQTT